MPPRRQNAADPNVIAIVNQVIAGILPNLIQAVNNNNNQPNQPDGIGRWTKEFQKHNPDSFIKADDPIEARNSITGMEKIFGVVGVEDQHKVRLATYKLKNEAQTWWNDHVRGRGGDAFVNMLTWNEFKVNFDDKYF